MGEGSHVHAGCGLFCSLSVSASLGSAWPGAQGCALGRAGGSPSSAATARSVGRGEEEPRLLTFWPCFYTWAPAGPSPEVAAFKAGGSPGVAEKKILRAKGNPVALPLPLPLRGPGGRSVSWEVHGRPTRLKPWLSGRRTPEKSVSEAQSQEDGTGIR